MHDENWKIRKGMKDARYSASWNLNCIAGFTLYGETAEEVFIFQRLEMSVTAMDRIEKLKK